MFQHNKISEAFRNYRERGKTNFLKEKSSFSNYN